MRLYLNYKQHILFFFALLVVFFIATYKLAESPTIWMDEGIITQVAQNIYEHGKHALQVAPQDYVSAGFVSTSYTVTFPVSISFALFGVGIIQARSVMVLFIMGLFAATYVFARGLFKDKMSVILPLFLIATFAPLYGHGKNVLGEIPGLFYLITGLCFVQKIEKTEVYKSKKTKLLTFTGAGIFLGLALVTKPIFILLGPALLLMFVLVYKKSSPQDVVASIGAFLLPVGVWFYIQFHNDSFINILSIYANPHSTHFFNAFKENIYRFFHEAQPLYCIGAVSVWLGSIVVRGRKKITVSGAEYGAAVFSIFIILAYVRTVGYYRYFFEAQYLALLFFPASLLSFHSNRVYRHVVVSLVCILILFQVTQVYGNSWVATYYSSHRTAEVEEALSKLPSDTHLYVYQAPEAVIFLPTQNYSQYMEVTPTIIVGKETLAELTDGRAEFVITTESAWNSNVAAFTHYRLHQRIDRYVILHYQPVVLVQK